MNIAGTVEQDVNPSSLVNDVLNRLLIADVQRASANRRALGFQFVQCVLTDVSCPDHSSFLCKCERGRPSNAISGRGKQANFLCESVGHPAIESSGTLNRVSYSGLLWMPAFNWKSAPSK